jgi:hypothetical protein
MKVKNLNGAGNHQCHCGSWFDHWKKFSGQIPCYCSEANCFFLAEVGTHVQKDVPNDLNWYIVPLCGFHNQSKAATLQIRPFLNLVSANINETCGK